MQRSMDWFSPAVVVAALALAGSSSLQAQDRFERTDSRNQYVHIIDLYDASKVKINPDAEGGAAPYSPMATCGKCHDYKSIAHGWHFNALKDIVDKGRPGEPWILTDDRTATQLPMSYRGWKGTIHPSALGMTRHEFTKEFGHHLPGGGPGAKPDNFDELPDDRKAAWEKSGELAIDCMMCHAGSRQYKYEAWTDRIKRGDFAGAPVAALNMGKISGAGSEAKVDYNDNLFNDEGKVYFDVIRKPTNNSCYYCHSNRPVGETLPADWTHDEDVHIRAGMDCADCHRNGIEHHTVRGYEGEDHPAGKLAQTLSCAGCHYGTDSQLGGRLGSPEPQHKGLPPIHFEKLSCTACHSGPVPGDQVTRMQTAMAHKLGLPRALRSHEDQPGIAAPIFAEADDGRIYPYRIMWPTFWGYQVSDQITPIDPDAVYKEVRSTLRVRKNLREELMDQRISMSDKAELLGEDRARVRESDLEPEEQLKLQKLKQEKALADWREKLPEALGDLQEEAPAGATAVFVAGGQVHAVGEDGESIVVSEHRSAEPYMWPLGHDVRPARQSLGVKGCAECHAPDGAVFHTTFTALNPVPHEPAEPTEMHTLQDTDVELMRAWEQSFAMRDTFKYVAFVALGVLVLTLLVFGVAAFGMVLRWVTPGGSGEAPEVKPDDPNPKNPSP